MSGGNMVERSNRRRTALFSALLTTSAALASFSSAPAQAQSEQTSQRQFNIPAQSVREALLVFSQQSDIQVTAQGPLVEGRTSNAISGQMAPAQALSSLLTGTGLTFRFIGANAVRIEPAPQASGDGAIQLGPVRVEGEGRNDAFAGLSPSATSDPLATEGTQSYTAGGTNTATRMPLTFRETPQSVSVITRQEMDDFALQSIEQVLERTPGISVVTYDNERVEFYARGFVIQNFQYDGMPSLYDGTGYPAGEGLTDMAIYDRVEVLKGANGLMTGTGDPGATINLIRKRPTRQLQGQVLLSAGSWNDYRGMIDVGGGLVANGNVRARAVATYRNKDSYMDHFKREDTVLYGAIEADLAPNVLLSLGGDYQKHAPKGKPFGGTPLFDTDGNFNDTPRSYNPASHWSTWDQETRSAFAALEYRPGSDWTIKLQLRREIGEYDSRNGSIYGSPDLNNHTGFLFVSNYAGKRTHNSLELYANGPFDLFGRTHELVLGGSLAKRRWDNETTFADAAYDRTVPNYDNYTWEGIHPEPIWANSTGGGEIEDIRRDRAAFASVRFNLHDDLKLLVGGRLMNYKSSYNIWFRPQTEIKNDSVLTPYVGAVLDLSNHLSLYASYTSIFKPQSAQDEQGQRLDPQKGDNYEIGIKGEFLQGRLNASAAWFQVYQDNYPIATGGLTPSGATAYEGIDGVKTKGFELEISGALAPNFEIHAGFTHKIARRDGGKVSTLTPENQFTLYGTYQFEGALAGLTVGGGARWQDKTWDIVRRPSPATGGSVDEKYVVPSYLLMDAVAAYKINENLRASLNLSNLLDKKYYNLVTIYGGSYTWGEPRSFKASIRYSF